MPPLTREEAVETTKIYSIAGQLPQGRGLITARPFRSPHHSASAVSLAGGGAQFRPGECSLANCGVLFLDELPEFSRESLEVLRQPLEDGQITVSRAAGSATYPSHFQLVAAMNPCKCGYYGHPTRQCTCSPSAVRQYRSRVSGPLLDRIDLCVEMDPIAFDELHTAAPAESSADLRKQVLAARAIQAKRYAAPGYEGVHCNAQLNAGQVRRICRMTPGAERLLRASYDAPINEDEEQYQTYFLNMVDESDLLALLDDDTAAALTTCNCKEKCAAGQVNTDCPVCKTNMSECTGTAPVTPEPDKDAETDAPAPKPEKKSNIGMILVIFVLAGAAGAAYYYIKFVKGRKPKDEDMDFFDDEGYEEEPYINEDDEPQIAEDAETDGDED